MNGVRWNREDRVFEGRCDACCEWLVLDPESRDDLWPVKGRGLRICRACDNLRSLARTHARRSDPAYREAERAKNRAYYASLSPAEKQAMWRTRGDVVEKRRAYQREWMRRFRAREEAA